MNVSILNNCRLGKVSLKLLNKQESQKRSIHVPTNLIERYKAGQGFNILGIETSCDDTAVAVMNSSGKVLSNVVNSQLAKHLANGGILPVHAARLHAECIDRVAKQAFRESGLTSFADDIQAVAVTNRPGLAFSLEIGINYGKKLAKKYSKPLIPIHHMQAHALMPLLDNQSNIKYPFIALLISGGHTLLAIAEKYNKFHLLGSEIDLACGTLLDKIARRLGLRDLGEPFDKICGGRAIELLAQYQNSNHLKYYNQPCTIPFSQVNDCNFSFSAFVRKINEEIGPLIDELKYGDKGILIKELSDYCSSLQRAVLVQLLRKIYYAINYHRLYWRYNNESSFSQQIKQHEQRREIEDNGLDVLVSGGCAANQYFVKNLRAHLQTIDKQYGLYSPPINLCSDNGAMIAWNGTLRLRHILDIVTHEGSFPDCDINERVVFDSNEFDKIEAIPNCLIGVDLRKDVTANQISLKDYKIFKYTSSCTDK